jgi:hypothetical protein
MLGVRASQSGQIKVEELSSPQVFWAEVEVPGAGFAVGVMLTRRRLPRSIRKPRIGKLWFAEMQARIEEQDLEIQRLRQQGAPAVPVPVVLVAPAPAAQAEIVVAAIRLEPLYERFRKQAPPVFPGRSGRDESRAVADGDYQDPELHGCHR